MQWTSKSPSTVRSCCTLCPTNTEFINCCCRCSRTCVSVGASLSQRLRMPWILALLWSMGTSGLTSVSRMIPPCSSIKDTLQRTFLKFATSISQSTAMKSDKLFSSLPTVHNFSQKKHKCGKTFTNLIILTHRPSWWPIALAWALLPISSLCLDWTVQCEYSHQRCVSAWIHSSWVQKQTFVPHNGP